MRPYNPFNRYAMWEVPSFEWMTNQGSPYEKLGERIEANIQPDKT